MMRCANHSVQQSCIKKLAHTATVAGTMPYVEYSKKMGGATFVGKDLGWVPFVDSKVQPQYPPTPSWNKSDTSLYLSIASLRDTLCPHTLFNAFSKAAYPRRLFVGVVQQNAPGDVDCFDEYCVLMLKSQGKTYAGDPASCPFAGNIRMLRVPSTQAKGPTWGRAKAATLLRDEEFCMQTDAHMDFVPHWDVHLMGMWAATGNEYGILSTYVADSDQLKYNINGQNGLNGLNEVPHLCMVTLDGAHGLVRVWGTKCARNLPKPKLTNAIWGAGLSFSKCHAERKAAYDPHTPFIFDGEEFSRAVRFWTWGYDIYTPNRVYVVHNYHVSQADPNHFDWYRTQPDPKEGTVEQSVFRLKTLFQIAGGETDPLKRLAMHTSRYGLGDRRTFDQALEFSGIDTRNHRITANRCGNIDLVPFVEHPWGADYIPRYDNVTEAFADVRDPGSVFFERDSDEARRRWEAAAAARNRGLPATRGVPRLEPRAEPQVLLRGGSSGSSGRQTISRETPAPLLTGRTAVPPPAVAAQLVVQRVNRRVDSSLAVIVVFFVGAVAFHYFRHRCHVGKKALDGFTGRSDAAIKTV